jgi:hypothetical protein
VLQPLLAALEVNVASIDNRIKDTLQYIKDNPDCNTEGIDANLVIDLIDNNLISGIKSGTLNKPKYCARLNLTMHGEERLESYSSTPSPSNSSPPHWHTNPFLLSFLSLCVLLACAYISWCAGWL